MTPHQEAYLSSLGDRVLKLEHMTEYMKTSDELVAELMTCFEYEHLPPALQEVSKPFKDLALYVIATSHACFMQVSALRKLVEAKDAAVRARLFVPPEAAKKEDK